MRNLIIISILALPLWVFGATLRSGTEQVTLLELYTSEGCSSCPPADRWFSELQDSPELWQQLVPVAFHVDYWNYLGWEDRFSEPEYAARQRQFKSQGAANAVYTPGMMAGGLERRDWRYGAKQPEASGQAVGELVLDVDDGELRASFDGDIAMETALELHVAVLGFGLQTPVGAGENHGELLAHDFVVLGYKRLLGSGAWQAELPEAPLAKESSRLGIAAWVSERGSVAPLQAVGGWLDSN